jgi:hypothetical protein
LVPHGFEAYGRILHPALAPYDRPVSWATVAEWSGGAVHSRVQFEAMAKPRAGAPERPAPFVSAPRIGNLPGPLLATLCQILASHTDSADRCWFCLWEGYGYVQGSPAVSRLGDPRPVPPAFGIESLDGPRVRLPNRDYLLFEGPLEAASDMGWRPREGIFDPQSPNLFWPDDHAWCVATEIDLDSTYVGGSAALIADLVGDDRLEALPVEVADLVWATSDVNL